MTALAGSAAPAAFDGGERIVAMNGSRLHEKRFGGEWTVQKSEAQGMLPTGIYRLDGAQAADPAAPGEYAGTIIHVDPKRVFQLHGNSVIEHDRQRFQQAPAIGEGARIAYQLGRATLANRPNAPALSTGPTAAPALDGSYTGPIVAKDATTATQLVNGTRIVHQLRLLTGKIGELAEGKNLAISYRGGIGKVADPQQQDRGRGR